MPNQYFRRMHLIKTWTYITFNTQSGIRGINLCWLKRTPDVRLSNTKYTSWWSISVSIYSFIFVAHINLIVISWVQKYVVKAILWNITPLKCLKCAQFLFNIYNLTCLFVLKDIITVLDFTENYDCLLRNSRYISYYSISFRS